MVEAAGVEPASENIPLKHLHTYLGVWISPLASPPSGMRNRPARWRSPIQPQALWINYPASRRPLPDLQEKNRQDGSCLRQLRRTHNRLRLCL